MEAPGKVSKLRRAGVSNRNSEEKSCCTALKKKQTFEEKQTEL